MKGLKELIDRIRKESDLTEVQVEEALNALLPETWVPKATFNEASAAKKNAETQLAELNKQLEEVKKSAGASEELKQQIATLQNQQIEAKAAYEKELSTTRKNFAIEQALSGAKAKNVKAVRALLDESKLVLGDDGSLSGLKEQLEAVQKDNGYLFDSGDPAPNVPSYAGGRGNTTTGAGGDLLSRMEAAAGIKASDAK